MGTNDLKTPHLSKDVRKSYSQKLNKIIGDLNPSWRSYPRENYPELFLSPKGMNLDNAFKGIELIRLSSKNKGNCLQVDIYPRRESGLGDKFLERGYEAMKKHHDIWLLIKPMNELEEVISELEFISETFEMEPTSKNPYSTYN